MPNDKKVDLDIIKQFFDDNIKQFLPYRDNTIYITIINNLIEYYYNYLYNGIPENIRDLVENSNITNSDIYNNLLVTIGVPQVVIDELTFSAKLVFLKSLSDFYRYKSTINFIEKVGVAYGTSDKVNIYELYLDNDPVDGLVFKPINIYKHEDVDLSITSIPFATISNVVPTLLYNSTDITTMISNNQLILPLKTNLLFLDYNLSTNISLLYDLILTIFLKEYRTNSIELYFYDNSLSSTLRSIYFAWYYLMARYYDAGWPAYISTGRYALIFNYNSFSIPYSITDIDSLITEYNSIDSVSKRDDFYKDKIATIFADPMGSTPSPITHTQMLTSLVSLDSVLAVYLDSRISAIADEDKQKLEISLILEEIYNSLVLYSETCGILNFTKYSEYLLTCLPQVVVNPEKTSVYTILYNMKPYHVEFYTLYRSGILCQDKFNTAWVEDKIEELIFIMSKASAATLADNMVVNLTMSAVDTDLQDNLLDTSNLLFTLNTSEDLSDIIDELFYSNFRTYDISSAIVADSYDFIV